MLGWRSRTVTSGGAPAAPDFRVSFGFVDPPGGLAVGPVVALGEQQLGPGTLGRTDARARQRQRSRRSGSRMVCRRSNRVVASIAASRTQSQRPEVEVVDGLELPAGYVFVVGPRSSQVSAPASPPSTYAARSSFTSSGSSRPPSLGLAVRQAGALFFAPPVPPALDALGLDRRYNLVTCHHRRGGWWQ